MAILAHDEILNLHAAVVAGQLVASRSTLLVGIDTHFVAGLPHAANPSDQILQDLTALNEAGALMDGSLPLAIWLNNALARTERKKEAAIFRGALARCGSSAASSVAPSQPDPPPGRPPPTESERTARKPVDLFFSYSHQDEELCGELAAHLALLRRQGVIRDWHDRRIAPGDDWKGAIDGYLDTADLILLLVSADFLASDYCYDVEMKRALERHARGQAHIMSVILRACDWKSAPLARHPTLPRNGKPVTSWANRDEGWDDVAQGVRAAVVLLRARSTDVHARRHASTDPGPPTRWIAIAAALCALISLATYILFASTSRDANAVIPVGMTRIDGGVMLIGSNQEEIAALVSQCRAGDVGSDCAPERFGREGPSHPFSVEPFLLDTTEVTFSAFSCWLEKQPDLLLDDSGLVSQAGVPLIDLGHDPRAIRLDGKDFRLDNAFARMPAVRMTWFAAIRFCHYQGRRLPTEREWEAAARGIERRTYPWGEGDPACNGVIFARRGLLQCRSKEAEWLGLAGSSPQDVTPPPESVRDLAGSVQEWTLDRYWPYAASGHLRDEEDAAHGEDEGDVDVPRTIRGGSWAEPAIFARGAKRTWGLPHESAPNLGFRCAASPDSAAVYAPTSCKGE